MDLLWSTADDDLTVRAVHRALVRERELAYTTVMTVLDRLAKKGLVTQQRDGRAFRYRAAGTREALTADLMREVLDEFADGDRTAALVHFLDSASKAERVALRQALAEGRPGVMGG